MKVLFVTGIFPRLTFIFRMIVAIAEQGHEVTVMARDPGDWKQFTEEFPLPSNLKVKYLIPDTRLFTPMRLSRFVVGFVTSIMRAPIASWRLLKLCQFQSSTAKEAFKLFIGHLPFLKLSADVVQYEFFLVKMQYPLIDKIIDAPTIVSCRGSDVHMIGILPEEQKRQRLDAILSASLVHCVSSELAQSVTRASGRTEGIWVNRAAVPIEQIKPKQSYNTNEIPIIVTVGRLDWIKGYDYLLAAFHCIKAAGIPFRGQIIGDGDLQAQMRFSIGDLDLLSEVELMGRLIPNEVFGYLHKADIFVLSSHEEGISNAALEAMAVGLPIVTTAAGGMEEAVRDGLDGYVIPVRDIPALVEKLTTLLSDSQLRERMGRSARERVETAFTLERQVKVFDQMYETIRLQRT